MASNILQRIKNIPASDERALEEIGIEIEREARRDIREVVKVLHSGQEEDIKKAAIILSAAGDIGLAPLLELSDETDVKIFVFNIEAAMEYHLNNRRDISQVLYRMLNDKRPVPIPYLPKQEEEIQPRRVCDEGYLMLRRLLSLEEEEDELYENEMIFLDLSDSEKDKEIGRYLTSKRWLNLNVLIGDEV